MTVDDENAGFDAADESGEECATDFGLWNRLLVNLNNDSVQTRLTDSWTPGFAHNMDYEAASEWLHFACHQSVFGIANRMEGRRAASQSRTICEMDRTQWSYQPDAIE